MTMTKKKTLEQIQADIAKLEKQRDDILKAQQDAEARAKEEKAKEALKKLDVLSKQLDTVFGQVQAILNEAEVPFYYRPLGVYGAGITYDPLTQEWTSSGEANC